MPWFKVDDKLHDHRKSRSAHKAAMGVWVLAGSWCADHTTDGFVPASVLSRWGTTKDAAALVTAGLWETAKQDGESGWRFHDWGDFQPTKAEIEAARLKKAEAGRKGGRRSGLSRREASASPPVTADASSFVEPPTRPDPTPSAAAAAETAAAAESLPTAIAILRSKLQAVTPLRALRFDGLNEARVDQLTDLLQLHGDQVLVDVAVRTCRTPPPVHVSAFLGTWAALPEPGRRLKVVDEPLCTIHDGQKEPAARCRYCAADRLAGDA